MKPFAAAVADIPDGAVIMVDGFGDIGGLPRNLILALHDQGAKTLTVISNHGGGSLEYNKLIRPPDGYIDHGILFENKQVKRVIGSVPLLGGMPEKLSPLYQQYVAGEIEL